MIILAPHVPGMLRPETAAWLREESYMSDSLRVCWLEIRPEYPLRYGEAINQMWKLCALHDEHLMIVEQDIVPPLWTSESFRHCGHWWCSNSYEVQWGNIAEVYRPSGAALGCTRFHRDLMRREPGLIREALERHEFPRKPAGHYLGLDSAIYHVLMARGYESHRHYPDATHLHEYPKLPEEQTANG